MKEEGKCISIEKKNGLSLCVSLELQYLCTKLYIKAR